jgi:hypothetical protein
VSAIAIDSKVPEGSIEVIVRDSTIVDYTKKSRKLK